MDEGGSVRWARRGRTVAIRVESGSFFFLSRMVRVFPSGLGSMGRENTGVDPLLAYYEAGEKYGKSTGDFKL